MVGTTVDDEPGGTALRIGASTRAGGVTVASYALVRVAGVTLPPPAHASREFRAVAARLLARIHQAERLAVPLADELHRLVGRADPARRRVLLTLRRDVHNGRGPSAALRARLESWTARPPALASWIGLRDEIDRLGEQLDALFAPGLAADRTALAEVCGSEELARAVALTSTDLLRALRRAAEQGTAPDDRARKSEATVLRYVLRAATRTTPLSWFTQVGWGWWDRPTPESEVAREVIAVAQVDRAALSALVKAVLQHPDRRGGLPHMLAPGLQVNGATLEFRRQSPAGDTPPGILREEKVTLPVNRPLRHLLTLLEPGAAETPDALAAALALRLPGGPEQARTAARTYLHALVEQGVLCPAYPVDPQAVDGPGRVADWLVEQGLAELADLVRELGDRTAEFAGLDAADRPAALAHLRSRWDAAFALVGADRSGRPDPVTEDVVLVRPVALGRRHGRNHLPALAAVAPLLEVFDPHAVIRRLVRDRFVARYGVGGRCDTLVEFAEEYTAIWDMLDRVGAKGTLDRELDLPHDHELRELRRFRTEIAAALATDDEGNAVVSDALLDTVARGLPRWSTARAVSYAVFGQTSEQGDLFCVNHVYGGWGQFTSRFLRYFAPEAGAAVASQLERHLGGRIAQFRPVNGYNGNLHPLLVGDEIAEDRQHGTLVPEDLRLVHDPASDQVRLVVAATGEVLDVLYLGFLVPMALPQRLISVLTDLGPGPVHLGSAMVGARTRPSAVGPVHHQPRLRYHDIVLARARWWLSADMVAAWRAELEARPAAVGQTAVRWRHLLGLPEHIFVGATASGGANGIEAFMSYLGKPRSQYVDLGSPLHLRCLARTLARYPDGVVIEEALPVPSPGAPATEVVIELYRGGTHE